jgi:soluble cytochrome b562
VLSISSVSVSVNPRQASQADEGWQQFAQLVRSVNAGDLPAAQKAYEKFTQSPAGDLAQANSNGRLAQALDKIGKALQSGDIGQAQQALSTIRPRAQGDQPAPTVTAPSISPAGPNAPGGKLNLTV